jgi:uncharacterized membrane protein
MQNIILYTSSTDDPPAEILGWLTSIQTEFPHNLITISVDEDLDVYKGYLGKTPVLEVGPYHLFTPFSLADIKMTLGAARDRHQSLVDSGDQSYQKKVERGATISGSDRFSYWLTRNYMLFFNTLLFIFVGLPFLAPVLERAGATLPASIIYKVYSPLCHQLAFRSWFLFGEQMSYPRDLAGLQGLSFEEATGMLSTDIWGSRNFTGNAVLGYKVALCERDVAIYGGLLLFGILFSLTGNRIKPIPWYAWVILGIVPMGIDGVTQLPGLLENTFAWLPVRESTPLLRTITGLLFGISTAAYGYPLIEQTMLESRKVLKKKFAVNQVQQG